MSLTHGHASLYPCPICLVPYDELSNASKTYPFRTTASMRGVYEEAQNLDEKEKEILLKCHGLRNIKVLISHYHCDIKH